MNPIDTAQNTEVKSPLLMPSLQYGIILGLASSLLFIINYLAKVPMDSAINQISAWALAIAAIVLILKNFRDKKNNGRLAYGRGVGLSCLSGLWSGIIYGLFFYIFLKYISPEYLELIQDKTISDMMDRGMDDDQIEKSMKMAGIFLTPEFMGSMVVLSSTFMYTLLGLIVTGILKKN